MPETGRLSPETNVDALRAVCLTHAASADGSTIDPYYGQAAAAVWRETDVDGVLRDPSAQAFEAHVGRGFPLAPAVMLNLISRGLHYVALQDPESLDYPQAFGPSGSDSIDAWQDLIHLAVSDPSKTFQKLIETRTINSTVPERARGMEIVMSLFPERFGNRHGLDVGANVGVLHKVLAVRETSVALGLEFVDAEEIAQHERVAQMAGSLAVTPLIRESLGIDITNCMHPSLSTWVMRCSVTPGEMVRNPYRLDILQSHFATQSDLVHFTRGDFLEQDTSAFPPQDFLDSFDPETDEPFRFDFATALTTAYLFDEDQRHRLIDQMIDFTTDDALLIIQDFCQADLAKEAKYNLTFAEDIYSAPWQYRLMALDKHNVDAGWQELMIFETGRCKRAKIGAGSLVVGDELLNLNQRLEQPPRRVF